MAIKQKFRTQLVANFERTPIVEGRIIDKDSAEFEGEHRRFVLIDTGKSEVKVFETQAMEEAFKAAEVGDSVYIEHLATVTTKNNRTFKQFDVRLWTDDTLPAIKAPTRTGRPRASATRK